MRTNAVASSLVQFLDYSFIQCKSLCLIVTDTQVRINSVHLKIQGLTTGRGFRPYRPQRGISSALGFGVAQDTFFIVPANDCQETVPERDGLIRHRNLRLR